MRRGEIIIGFGLALLGVFWTLKSLELSYMGRFSPGSGFLPFWIGLCLTMFSACLLFARFRAAGGMDTMEVIASGEWRKPLVIAVGLAVCVLIIDLVGFLVAVSLYLCFLLKFVEHRSWTTTLSVGVGATVVMFFLFRSWLGVPLPLGFFGA
jgi:hypothetical protein